MARTLDYNGYIGTIEPDLDDGMLYGKVINIDGAIMYEGKTLDELQKSMGDAIENYLAHCRDLGQAPDRPMSGKMQVRLDPADHARLAATAESEAKSMNQVIVEALRSHFGTAQAAIQAAAEPTTMRHARATAVETTRAGKTVVDIVGSQSRPAAKRRAAKRR